MKKLLLPLFVQVKASLPLIVFLTCTFVWAMSASAQTAYLENFDSDTTQPYAYLNSSDSPTVSDPLIDTSAIGSYWLDASQGNGIITQCTGGGSCYPTGNVIANDASGSGYFLFENTKDDTSGGSNTFFASSDFSVNPDTEYTVSFDLANATTANFADVQAQINGTTLGDAQLTLGAYPTTQWLQFSFTWDSGSNTTADLDLLDLQTGGGDGNDFGVDDISVAVTPAVPEPGTLTLLGTGLLGLAGTLKRKFFS